MKKVTAIALSLAMCIGVSLNVYAADPSITITSAVEQSDKSIVVTATVDNPVENQQLTIMASEIVDGTYDINTINYIDQLSYDSTDGFVNITFLPSEDLDPDKEYLVRMGGTGISEAVYVVITTGEVVGLYGDADNDGFITAADAATTLQYVLNKTSLDLENVAEFLKRVEVTNDGVITAEDASEIYQKSLKSTHEFPVEKQQ